MKHTFVLRLAAVALLAGTVVMASGCRGKKAEKARAHFGDKPLGSMVEGTAGTAGASADGSLNGQQPGYATGEAGDGAAGYGEGSVPPGTLYDAESGGIVEMTTHEALPLGAMVPELSTVYFDYDSDELTESARAMLDRNAAYLVANPLLKVVLRGHTDDLGTEEYNISLGSRRAQSVREYLTTHEVDASRLNTVSFGKSMPAVEGDDDATRAENRRVEFFVFTE